MLKEILLPDLGEGIDSADVSEILINPGDSVSIDDIILVLESDKASMEIPAEDAGVVKEVFVNAGDEVKTGAPLISIEVSSGSTEESKPEPKEEEPKKEDKETKIETKAPEIKSENISSDKTFASPGVRRLARELDIDLTTVNATGPKGRITKDDLHGFIKQKMAQGGSVGAVSLPKIDFSQWGSIDEQPLTKIQKITGDRLQQAWQTIPHVTQFDEADISVLNKKRIELKKEGEKKNIKVTFLPFIIKAVIKSLKEFPRFNSSLDHLGENLVLKNYYNIGIAVDTPTGLVVPVIKNADNKSILGLSEELMDLSERARTGKLKPDEFKGGCFTISSLGGIGGTNFTPIINPPEVAIMGVSKSIWKPVYDHKNKEIVPTFMMPFSLSYDHRVIDGAIGAAFTSFFSNAVLDVSTFE
ncbi:MAG: 2-oxo acid dehydrogenase subunit E2 [bacterium]|jgi:pyruvate dehydrogenase E2 component (dihydrolipoamide acetyltransferase)|tara:strand:- start:297 stop:1541 length:1245 start_codon:yes stop_codon:yes gene_type:complete